MLLLVVASMPVALLSPRTLTVLRTPNIDESWFIDSSYKAVHGIWLGKRVLSTYGPVLQVLCGAPVLLTGYSLGKADATWTTVPMWAAFLLCALTLQLLLPEQPAWKRFVLLIFLMIFWASPGWAPPEVRPFVSVFLFALFFRGWLAVRQQQMGPVVFAAGSAVLCTGAFLVAADVGMYAIAGFLITLGGTALEKENRRHFFRNVAFILTVFGGSCVVLILFINTVLRTVFDFTFWKASMVMVSSYRWYEPYQMSKADKAHVLATLLVGAIVLAARGVLTRCDDTAIGAQKGFLAAAFVYGFVALQSALVRSDAFHVQMAEFAMILFIGVVLFGFRSDTGVSTAAVIVAVTFCWLVVDPNTMYYSWSVKDRYSKIAHPVTTCPAGLSEFDRLCVGVPFAHAFQETRSFIQQRSAPSDSILVFPWNNIFGSVTGRNVAGGIMLSYVASDSYLSDVDIRGLAQASPPVGLYFDEGWGWPVDLVPNFTRNAPLWFWVQSHYRAEQLLPSGILGLRADYSRMNRIHLESQSLQLPPNTYRIVRRVSTIDLGVPVWPKEGADFLRLRLNVHYPIWWKLRKPSHIQLVITRADGSSKAIPFIVKPNIGSDLWFHPWDNGLLGYFSSVEADWHAGTRSPITHLQLQISPLDWVSVIPESVSVETADAVRLTLAE